jgi:hypothetical protein
MTMFNQSIIAAADEVARAAQRDFFSIAGHGAVTMSAIAGGGKTHLVVDTVGQCLQIEMRVAVGAPTNEQVFSLVRSIATSYPGQTIAFVPAANVVLPSWAILPNVQIISPGHRATGQAVVVGTIDKLASARHPRSVGIPALGTFDGLIMDESYQASSGRYYALADIAPKHLCVGDNGQIRPFTSVKAGRQWTGLPEDPLQTAMDVLHRNHPSTPAYRFPITRRLDGRGARIAKSFYPANHDFGAAVAEGVRQMQLGRGVGGSARCRSLDKGIDLAAEHGWAYLELPACHSLVADPDIAQVIVDFIERLRVRTRKLVCERHPGGTDLLEERIAVAVSHNDQKAMTRVLLDQAGMHRVVVDTANKLQGLEYDVVVCWHPMAGLDEPDEFHLEAGRMCVMCTRHRHACIVVGRSGDRELVDGLPPSAPAWPGAEIDDLLKGWEVHQSVFSALMPHHVRIGL